MAEQSSVRQAIEKLLGVGGRLASLLPEYDYRPQQVEAAVAIAEAVQTGRGCIVEAGTGVGKTLAYLIPAAMAAYKGQKVVVSTYTINLQSQLMEKDIPLLQALLPQVALRPCLLKGRGRYLCKQDMDVASGDLFHSMDPNFQRIQAWSRTTTTGDGDELPFFYERWSEIAANTDTCRGRNCAYFDSCFYFRARRQAHAASLVVVNHALLLTDLVTKDESEDGSGLLPDYDVLIVDEAHHLETAATHAFTIALPDWEIPAFLERVRRLSDAREFAGLIEQIHGLNEELFSFAEGETTDFDLADKLDEFDIANMQACAASTRSALMDLFNELEERRKRACMTSERDAIRIEGFQRTATRLADTLAAILSPGNDRVRWCQFLERTETAGTRRGGNRPRVVLNNTPVAVGPALEAMLWNRIRCSVLTSATLATSDGFRYVRGRLGLGASFRELQVGSPFDYPSQALLYVPAHLPPPPRTLTEDYLELVLDEMRRIVELTEGRTFLLFTSRKALNWVYRRLTDLIPYPIFRQGDMPPARLLEAYRNSGNGVLLGNQTFWEGVDVQGSALSAVVIDRIPFPVPDAPIIKARAQAIRESGGDDFWDFSIPQAQIRLKQGFGRLIRTRNDRGIVCILDSRLVHKTYGLRFVDALPPASFTTSWGAVVRFWRS